MVSLARIGSGTVDSTIAFYDFSSSGNSDDTHLASSIAYKDEICESTDYNFGTLDPTTLYGNPWQLIWVFEGDPSTKVVCEGYSKAFKFLCDLTQFNGNVNCILATGALGSVGHMWNVVSIEDGHNYLKQKHIQEKISKFFMKFLYKENINELSPYNLTFKKE